MCCDRFSQTAKHGTDRSLEEKTVIERVFNVDWLDCVWPVLCMTQSVCASARLSMCKRSLRNLKQMLWGYTGDSRESSEACSPCHHFSHVENKYISERNDFKGGLFIIHHLHAAQPISQMASLRLSIFKNGYSQHKHIHLYCNAPPSPYILYHSMGASSCAL